MTQLDQSKHEPLARACAELVGDYLAPSSHITTVELYIGDNVSGQRVTATEYIHCKNLAGRVLDALLAEYGKPTVTMKVYKAMTKAIIYFMTLAWRDTPQALQNIMEAAGRLDG